MTSLKQGKMPAILKVKNVPEVFPVRPIPRSADKEVRYVKTSEILHVLQMVKDFESEIISFLGDIA